MYVCMYIYIHTHICVAVQRQLGLYRHTVEILRTRWYKVTKATSPFWRPPALRDFPSPVLSSLAAGGW